MKFSPKEFRGLLFLLPVLAVVSWLAWELARPRESAAPTNERHDSQDSLQSETASGVRPRSVTNSGSPDPENIRPQLFAFDPNTIEYHDLLRLGFTRGEALGIVKYRARGKIFEIPEDFAACYQVSEEMFRRLRPYIAIGETFRLKPFARNTRNHDHSPESNRIAQNGTGTEGAAAEFPDNRSKWAAQRQRSSLPVELNSADSAALVGVSGIGALTAGRIVAYRARLGGFARVEQLAEVRGVTEQNFKRILPQISLDTLAITKISINFASAKSLAAHPYIRGEQLRKLLSQRQLKGGWSTAEELKQENIFTADEFQKLLPYLVFN